MTEDGVGVERGGRETAVGGGGGCWEDTWDVGGIPPTPWGEAVEGRCRGDDNPPATTKNTRGPVSTISRVMTFNLISARDYYHDCRSRSDRRSVTQCIFRSKKSNGDFGSLLIIFQDDRRPRLSFSTLRRIIVHA